MTGWFMERRPPGRPFDKLRTGIRPKHHVGVNADLQAPWWVGPSGFAQDMLQADEGAAARLNL